MMVVIYALSTGMVVTSSFRCIVLEIQFGIERFVHEAYS